MSNTISFSNKYASELDKMIMQEAKTGFFADGKFKAMFTSAKTVLLPELTLDGLGEYSRSDGYSKGDVGLKHTEYQLGMERSKQLIIDAQDADESGVGNLVGQTVGEYTRLKVNPEIDAYVLSTLYGVAQENTHTTAFDKDTAVEQMLDAINKAEAANGYNNEPLVAFVNPVMYAALMTSDKLERHITVSDFKQGEVNLKVKNLNGCAIIPVAADRMMSEYEFSDNGFAAKDTAVAVNAIILPKGAANLVKKVDKVNVYSPDVVQDLDAYKINFRLYYDCFVTSAHRDLVFAIGG